MDFDEYDYLEMTVENPVSAKDNNEGGEKLENGEEKERYSKRKSDEDAYKQDYKTKKPRHDDEKREQEEDDRGDRDRRGRGGGHRSPQYQRDRGRANGRDRERYKSNRVDDRDRDRGRRDNRGRDRSERDYRDKERGRDRGTKDVDRLDKERVPDKEKERERYRDRDREREKRSKEPERKPEREKDQEKIKEKETPDDKDIPREKERDKEYSRPKREKKEDAGLTEPEADPERDQRTVFAWQISLKADERDVYEFFSQAGKVRDVRLIMDRNSRRSKGVGYVEFYDAMSVPVAIAMTGQVLLGQPVMVKPSEAEKNLAHSAANALANNAGYNGPLSGGARRLYVGNLHFHMTEDQLRQVFEPFGVIELVQLPLDADTGLCKGFGFVQYQRLEDARSAQQALNGVLELAGRPIKVSAVTDQFGMQEPGATQGDLDDDEGGGLALNARSRALLMQKLDRSGAAPGVLGATNTNPIAAQTLGMLNAGPGVSSSVTPLVANPLLAQGLPGMGLSGLQNAALIPPMTDSIGVPSSCLLLKNMFDPKTETEPDFDLDIKDDVQEECLKFGLIKHIFVDKNSEGHVYLRFDSAIAATKAQQALHGRWFAGKMITATFMTISAYEEKFPESG